MYTVKGLFIFFYFNCSVLPNTPSSHSFIGKRTSGELEGILSGYSRICYNLFVLPGALVQRENTSLAAKGSPVRIRYAPSVN